MKLTLGPHSALPEFIRALIKEHSVIELTWLQKDRPTSAKGKFLFKTESSENKIVHKFRFRLTILFVFVQPVVLRIG